jgi:hypothetical protein
MIWAILLCLGVPLWLCASGLTVLLLRNRTLRHRPGNMKVRRRLPGKTRWVRGYGVWVRDVFAFRGSPAAWTESLVGVREVVSLVPSAADSKKLRRMGSLLTMVRFIDDEGASVDLAVGSEQALDLLGSYATTTTIAQPESSV